MSETRRRHFRRYGAYGLKVRSVIPLTEFSPCNFDDADVVVTYGNGAEATPSTRPTLESIEIDPREAKFCFPDVGRFIVRSGSEIVVFPEAGVAPGLLRLYIQGMMMGMILHQRGLCVLHSSVINYQGSAVALLGHVGAGKSSMAAAMYGRGYRVMADDNAAISFSDGRLSVVPSFPYVKLFPKLAEVLDFEKGELRSLDGSQAKRAGRVAKGFTEQPSPLDRIYVLGREFGPEVARLSKMQATIELIRNSIPTRWGHAGDAAQLQKCALITSHVSVFTLRTFTELAAVKTVADQLERHLSESPAVGVHSRSSGSRHVYAEVNG